MFNNDVLYKRLITSSRWVKLRNSYIKEHPICEICHEKLATEVHHIKPLMQYRNDPELMEKMCFDEENIIAVCHEDHNQLHRELGKFTHRKEDVKNITKERLNNFYEKYF